MSALDGRRVVAGPALPLLIAVAVAGVLSWMGYALMVYDCQTELVGVELTEGKLR